MRSIVLQEMLNSIAGNENQNISSRDARKIIFIANITTNLKKGVKIDKTITEIVFAAVHRPSMPTLRLALITTTSVPLTKV